MADYLTEIQEFGEISQDARERLLDAAEKLFCEKGFEATSVRDLTAEAGCNVAAVNYHFGGKEPLYQEMFRRRLVIRMEEHFQTIERICSGENPTLEDLVSGLVRPPLEAVEQKDPWAQVVRMMVREALNHRLEIDKIIGEIKKLFFDRLAEAFMQLLPELDNRAAQKAVLSVDSLIIHPILFMENYFYLMENLTVDEIVEQIVRFGSAGVRSCVKGAGRE